MAGTVATPAIDWAQVPQAPLAFVNQSRSGNKWGSNVSIADLKSTVDTMARICEEQGATKVRISYNDTPFGGKDGNSEYNIVNIQMVTNGNGSHQGLARFLKDTPVSDVQ